MKKVIAILMIAIFSLSCFMSVGAAETELAEETNDVVILETADTADDVADTVDDVADAADDVIVTADDVADAADDAADVVLFAEPVIPDVIDVDSADLVNKDDLDSNIHNLLYKYADGKAASCKNGGADGYEYWLCENQETGTIHVHAIVIPAPPHQWGAWKIVQGKTCTEGTQERECTVCKEKETRSIAIEHAWRLNFVDKTWPTCVTKGTVTWQYVCETCGAEAQVYTCDILIPDDKSNLIWQSYPWFNLDEEKAKNDGMTDDMIQVVTDHLNDLWWEEVVLQNREDTVHVWDEWVTTVEPTCTKTGTAIRICKACEAKQMKTVPVLDPPYIVKAQQLIDCFTLRVTYVCPICDGKEKGHQYTIDESVQAHTFVEENQYIIGCSENIELTYGTDGLVKSWKFTKDTYDGCEKDGYLLYDCIHNNYDPEDPFNVDHPDEPEWYQPHKVIVPAKGHNWGEWQQVIEKDQNNSGNVLNYWIRKCKDCGKNEELVTEDDFDHIIPATCTTDSIGVDVNGKETVIEGTATGHSIVVDAAVAPTCTETGLAEGSHCANCDAMTVAQEVIPATGHDWSTEVILEPNCQNDGKTLKTCNTCGAMETEVLPAEADAHKAGAPVQENVKEATCTKEGSYDEVVYCTVCEAELSRETKTVEKIAHTPAEAVIENVVEAIESTTKTYDKVVYCAVCNTELSRETVEEEVIAEIVADADALTLKIGDTKDLLVTVTPAVAAQGLTFTSSKENVATVDAAGKVSAKAAGTTIITASVQGGEVTADYKVTVLFNDVTSADTYYYDAVNWAAETGITTGTSADLYSPMVGTTRAQVVTFLWRQAGSPEPKGAASFADVSPNAYYAKAVAWAQENGITTGYAGTNLFGPNDQCTREQVVTFLYRASGSPAVAPGSTKYTDVKAGAYYENAIKWADKANIVALSGSHFGVGETCTRGMIITYLYRATK